MKIKPTPDYYGGEERELDPIKVFIHFFGHRTDLTPEELIYIFSMLKYLCRIDAKDEKGSDGEKILFYAVELEKCQKAILTRSQ